MDELESFRNSAKTGNYSNLLNFFQNKKFGDKEIDEGFRIFLENFNPNNDDYYKSLKLFIKHSNVNYQNSIYKNTTILFCALNLGLIPQLLKIIYYFKCIDGEEKLNINIYDNDGNGILNKIITSKKFKTEDERYEVFFELISESPDINHINNEGHTLLSLSVLYGKFNISKYLINLNFNVHHIINSTGDTLLHCAVKSRNLLCLNLLTNYFIDDLEIKNLDGNTPKNLAKILNYNEIFDYLDYINREKNLHSEIDFLDLYKNKKFITLLSYFNVNENNDKLDNFPLLWNTLLLEYNIENNKDNINDNNLRSISESFYSNIIEFFEKNASKMDYDFQNISYNQMILNYKLGNIQEIETLFNNYKKKYINYNENEKIFFNYWICYMNINFILLEYYISIRRSQKSSNILARIDLFLEETKFSFVNSPILKNNGLISYLNSIFLINQTNNIQEIVNFYKVLKYFGEGNIKKIEELFKNTKNTTIKKNENLPLITKRIKYFYKYLKIILLYHQNNKEILIKKMEEFNINSNININIINEDYIFYYNTLGIINLRSMKLKMAEFCFKKCIQYIYSVNNNERLVNDIVHNSSFIWFNLGLTYFYLKNYEKSKKIFLQLKNVQKFKFNPCLYYRLGCCYLELEMITLNNIENNTNNDLLQKIDLNDDNNNNDDQCLDGYENARQMPSTNKMILLRTKDEDIFTKENINESINYFKQALFIINTDYNSDNKEQTPKYLIKIFNFTYISLIFAFSILESWNEIIYYSQQFRKSKFFMKENEQILNNYLIQSFINLNIIDKALQLIKKEINNLTNHHDENYIMLKKNFYSNQAHKIYSNVIYKVSLYVNYIKINLIHNNLADSELGIKNIIKILKKASNNNNNKEIDLPIYLINVILYFLLLKGRKEESLQLINKKKIPEFLNS